MRCSSSNGRPVATACSSVARTRSRSSACTNERWASSVPSNSSGSTSWMRWSSSVHWTTPLPTSHSHEPECTRASASRARDSISASVACRDPLLRDVARDEHRPGRPAGAVDDRRDRQRDRQLHAVLAPRLGLEVVHPVAREHGVEQHDDVGLQVVGEQHRGQPPDGFRRRIAEDPLRAAVPARDARVGIVAEDRVVGRLHARFEHGEAHGRRVEAEGGAGDLEQHHDARPRSGLERGEGRREGDGRAVAVHAPQPGRCTRRCPVAGYRGLMDHRGVRRVVAVGEERVGRLTDHPGTRAAEESLGRRVDVDDPAIGTDRDDAAGEGVEQRVGEDLPDHLPVAGAARAHTRSETGSPYRRPSSRALHRSRRCVRDAGTVALPSWRHPSGARSATVRNAPIVGSRRHGYVRMARRSDTRSEP